MENESGDKVNPVIADYIKRQRNKAISDDIIKAEMKKSGWSDENIEKAFSSKEAQKDTPIEVFQNASKGKGKIVTYPLACFGTILFLPFVAAGVAIYQANKRIPIKRNKYIAYGVIGVLTVFLTFFWYGVLGASEEQPAADTKVTQTQTKQTTTSAEKKKATDEFKVVAVVDGDTIEIEGGKKVRYIGINTPETVDPSSPIQCYGKEASDKNKELVEGKTVKLEKDVSETDKYGRLLRYVYVGDTFVNDYLVRQGYANASSYPPDVKHQEKFSSAEKEAKDNNRGLWSKCETGAAAPPPPPPPPVTSNQQSGNCDPSYPSVCIPKYPPDLDCGDITFRRFTVLPPDPHKFDGKDNDGIGCES